MHCMHMQCIVSLLILKCSKRINMSRDYTVHVLVIIIDGAAWPARVLHVQLKTVTSFILKRVCSIQLNYILCLA